jgi:hypothetical protein
MKTNYRIDIQNVGYNTISDELQNVVYNVTYKISLWVGTKTLENTKKASGVGEDDVVYYPDVVETIFTESYELNTENTESFVPFSEVSEMTLVQWLLEKREAESIEDLYLFKNLVKELNKKVSANQQPAYSPVIGSL